MNTKLIVFSGVALAAAAAIGYMIYEGSKKPVIAATQDFNKDDQLLYDFLRKDLQGHLSRNNVVYGAWFDDIVAAEYNNGANVNGRKSKAAALLAAINNTEFYPDKRRYYAFMVNQLSNRYK